MPRLLIVSDDGVERVVELTERTVQIGRGPGNDVVLPDAQKGVSRTHAELRFRNGRCVIVDLQSQNGTYLNGHRVEHAEVPFDAEIGVGSYRLRLESMAFPGERGETDADEPPPTVGYLHPSVNATITERLPDLALVRPTQPAPVDSAALARSAPAPRSKRAGLVAAAAILALAVVLWVFVGRTPDNAASEDLAMPDEPTAARAPTPESVTPPLPPVTATPTVAEPPAAQVTSVEARSTAPPARNGRPALVPAATLPADPPLVARKPGETVEAWRTRTAAFQTRYAYSRAALDRGDYAAAAGGFEAILREEPGFLDVPQLLLRARAGLRDVARDVFEAGKRLDAAGDWLGALQKYEQAAQIHPEVRGLPEAVKQVREKLRVAGEGAIGRARRFDESGRWTDALKEYEKAVQWLPPDDPKREMAIGRIEQLKKAVQ